MFDCEGCFKSKTLKIALSKFPIESKVYGSKANAGLFKETELKEVTNTIINNLDKSFQSKYRTTLTAQLKKILTSSLERVKAFNMSATGISRERFTQFFRNLA